MENKDTHKGFVINLFALEHESYEYDYNIDDNFFGDFEDSLIEKGDFDVKIKLEKRISMISIDFDIKGIASFECHKTLKPFEEPFDVQQRIVFKLGDHFEELSDEMYTIPENMDELDLSTYIYEVLVVRTPFRLIHPDLREEDEENDEEELIYSSLGSSDLGEEEEEQNEGNIDPRWQALNSLKNKN